MNGREEWILVHIEIEAGTSKNFARRMFQYYYRIYDRFEVEIAALAVFTGGNNQYRPLQYRKDFLGTKIIYDYNAYGILDHSEVQLLKMNNPFALIVLAAQKALLMDKIPEEELGEQRLTIARALIKSQRYDSEQIRRFLYFLKTFIHIENSEINSKFDKEINSLTQNRHAMGIIETIKMLAEEEGVERGKVTIVKSLLQNTDFDNFKIAKLCDVPEEVVIQIKSELST